MIGTNYPASRSNKMQILISTYGGHRRDSWWLNLIGGLEREGHDIIHVISTSELPIAQKSITWDKYSAVEAAINNSDTYISVDNYFPHYCYLHDKTGIVIFDKNEKEYQYEQNCNMVNPDTERVIQNVSKWSNCPSMGKRIDTTAQVADRIRQATQCAL